MDSVCVVFLLRMHIAIVSQLFSTVLLWKVESGNSNINSGLVDRLAKTRYNRSESNRKDYLDNWFHVKHNAD